jgi:hypothetical protein
LIDRFKIKWQHSSDSSDINQYWDRNQNFSDKLNTAVNNVEKQAERNLPSMQQSL